MGIPHLATPFRIENGRAATVDQDTAEDIAQSVRILVTTTKGSRPEVPGYGVPPALGRQSTYPVTNNILAAAAQWEPRARIDVQDQIDSYDQLVRDISIRVTPTNLNV